MGCLTLCAKSWHVANTVTGARPMEEWTVHYFDKRLNSEEVSRIFASKEGALRHACDLELKNCITHHIRGPNEQRILAPAISVWCRQHRSPKHPK